MAIAIALFLIVVGSILYHFGNPWVYTEIGSNWGSIDTMLQITFLITGVVFAAVTLFLVWAVVRFRHKEGSVAHYEPENRKLEYWLLGLTAVGIGALLVPGLVVYRDFVNVPDDAIDVEVVGSQWQFHFRYPGEDGVLGASHVRYVGSDNRLGLQPDDPAGADDIPIVGGDMYLPVDRPVRLLLRSQDVLHSYYVPHFRAKMDMVPGMVTSFWFTPTRTGRYQILCTQHCGVGHFQMVHHVTVVEQDEFDAWLAEQQTFGEQQAALAERVEDPAVTRGRQLSDSQGCLTCHSVDGTQRVGPTWLGLYESEVTLADGSTVIADEEYIRRSITEPTAQLTQGFPPVMPAYDFPEEDMEAFVAFIRSLGDVEDVEAVTPPDEEPPAEAPATDEAQAVTPEWGAQLVQGEGCLACHTIDGSASIGPTFLGMYGRNVELEDGRTVVADEDYIRESITDPTASVTAGYPEVMPPYNFTDEQLDALIAYFREELSEE